ncbi:MAG: sigma-70 family RNA polymerase sigma factor [Phenylobacterium sp.]|uniref:RNA polymerase sigma factor n=1 Tax=Phenylobacterium sp. TaxID=1871053 RepID=UPI00273221C6|nr:sigma-70 family RNA polymerase sigma factor [Phenylobacterium sp.]MDP2010518.1 sigma-70 family RNA polymerase sigma factor [Phenylobacterium sp.]
MNTSGPSKDEGQNALLRAYFEKRTNLVRFFAARTGSLEAAEDLAQDLYLKLSTREDPLETWAPVALLYRIATNLMLDRARAAQRSANRDAGWRMVARTDLGGAEIDDAPAADEVIVSRQRLSQLIDAVAELPPQMGRAFRLHKLEGLSQIQTAQVMGVSVKAVEKHVSVALRTLIRKLQP